MKTNDTAQTAASKTAAGAKSGKQHASSKTTNGKHNDEKQSSKQAQGLRDLFEDSLKDIYWAEKALVKALPKMMKQASSEELVAALEEHLAVTEGQVTRLEQVFETLGKAARAKKCEAMEGLIKEAEGIMEETEEGMVRDAGIIAAGQKVEHYEIATYGTLCAFAKILGEDDVVSLLEESLNEEKEADIKLTEVTEATVNIGTMEEDEADEEEDMEMTEDAPKNKKSK